MNQELYQPPIDDLPRPNGAADKFIRTGILVLVVFILITLALIARSLFTNLNAGPRTAIENNLLIYTEQVKKNPKDGEAHLLLAATYADMGRYDQARESFKSAIKHLPNPAEAYLGLGQVQRKTGELEEAIKSYKQAVKFNDKSAAGHFQLAAVYAAQGKYKLAAARFEDSLEIEPGGADAHYQLGLVYEKMGQKAKAKREFQAALFYVPDLTQAKKALERLGGAKQ